MSYQVPAAVLLGDHDICGHRHAVRVLIRPVLPLADRVRHSVFDERGRLRFTVPGAGVADVVPAARLGPAGGGSGRMVGHGGAGGSDDGVRRLRRRPRYRRRHRHAILDGVGPAHHLEAHAHFGGVLRVPAGQRFLRAAVLLGGRAARHQGAVGRRLGHRVSVRVPSAGQPGVLHAAPRQPEDAGGRLRRRHGRVPGRHHRVPALVQRHP